MIDTVLGILMIIFYVSAVAMMLIMLIDTIIMIIDNRKFKKQLEEQHKKFIEMLERGMENEEDANT